MNNAIKKFAQKKLKSGLSQLPEGHQLLFKRMYSHKNLNADINVIVDNLPDEKLDWAMQQVENSLNKLNAAQSCGDNNRKEL